MDSKGFAPLSLGSGGRCLAVRPRVLSHYDDNAKSGKSESHHPAEDKPELVVVCLASNILDIRRNLAWIKLEETCIESVSNRVNLGWIVGKLVNEIRWHRQMDEEGFERLSLWSIKDQCPAIETTRPQIIILSTHT